MNSKITDNLIQQVVGLTANEMMFLIAEANRLNNTKAKKDDRRSGSKRYPITLGRNRTR